MHFSIFEFKKKLKDGNIIGIDYGEKKIGIAISSPDRSYALPLCRITNKQDPKIFASEIKNIVISRSVVGIVIGYAVHIDGNKTQSSQKIENVADTLANYLKLPIYFQEERRTSRLADSLLKIAGLRRKERNAQDDLVAATIILDSALGSIRANN
ncbi:MAG: Holliday junction resolvase RuvX [Rickettsiaceae bacterium]|nr:Holliday junction resolvase RuvX [Rickettsiaceae bacterium]